MAKSIYDIFFPLTDKIQKCELEKQLWKHQRAQLEKAVTHYRQTGEVKLPGSISHINQELFKELAQ